MSRPTLRIDENGDEWYQHISYASGVPEVTMEVRLGRFNPAATPVSANLRARCDGCGSHSREVRNGIEQCAHCGGAF